MTPELPRIGNPNALCKPSFVATAARDLAKTVERAARLVGLEQTQNPLSIAASGGVLVSSKSMRDRLQAELEIAGLPCVMQVVDVPLEGCVRLAVDEFAGTLVEWQ